MRALRVARCGLRGPLRLAEHAWHLATRNSQLLPALFALFLALPLFADLTTASLTGRVQIGDAPAAGITVTVSSPALPHPRTTVTNARGRYWLDSLPPGTYDVTFSRAGLTTLTRRAVVQLARTARADAALEESADEESVTSTATTPSVADTIAITTHADDGALDRLPVRREVYGMLPISPRVVHVVLPSVDDLPLAAPFLVAEEALEQMTLVRGAAPVEVEGPAAIVARTRSGRDGFFFSLRDTLTSTEWIDDRFSAIPQSDDVQHHIELAAGGRIVPDRLWLFGSAWTGDEADAFRFDQRGVHLKLDAAAAPAHHLTASYFDAESTFFLFARDEANVPALRYTGVYGPRFSADAQWSRAMLFNPVSGDERLDLLSTRGSFFAGNHVLTGGATASRVGGDMFWTLFAADRWSVANFTVYAGARHHDSPARTETFPRLAVTYDLHGNGRRALFASYGEYSEFGGAIPIASLGFATTIGANGHARVDIARSEPQGTVRHEVQFEARYRLFDRFEAGANYSYLDDLFTNNHFASGWIGAELSLGAHQFGATVLQHVISGDVFGGVPESRTVAPTDIALRYSIPVSRARLTLAADATNAFAVSIARIAGRSMRFWIRLRV